TIRSNLRAGEQQGSNASNNGVPAGPPPNWSTSAKGEWERLPDSVKVARYREEAALTPRLQEHAEIAKSLDHLRPMLKQQGLSDAAAVKRLVEWENNLRNPATRDAAFQALHQAYGYQPQQQQVAICELQRRAGGG